MTSPQRIDRKLFLTFTLTSGAALALGCSSDPDNTPAGGAGAGGAGVGGSGTAGSGTAGSPSAGAPAAGSSGSSAGAAGSGVGGAPTAGAGGSAAGGVGGAPVTPECGTKLKTLITGNHMHVFDVTNADVMAGVDKVYDTQGQANHPHWIQLTAADFTTLKNGGTVRKLSCNDGHEHEYIVNCIGQAMPQTSNGISDHCDLNHKCADSNTNFCPALPPVKVQ